MQEWLAPGRAGESMTKRARICGCMVAVALAGCLSEVTPDLNESGPIERVEEDLAGANLGGANLAGANLAGANLAGANLAGANLGGTNLAANNLAGANLAGANLGGNNLAGANMSATNLAGANLAGANLAGANLAGANLGGSNLAGSNVAGANTAGNNIAGTNLAGSNLAGSNLAGANSGANIHNLTGSAGMLYSREDVWTPKAAQCVVMGIGSTAFPKLLNQQSPGARLQVALGKLPWGFAGTAGGPLALRAWEAVVWGDKTYCVFVLVAAPEVTWPGVAGFIKAIFRWNAPPTQEMDISGIDAARSAPVSDTTTSTAITTYAGMMGAAARSQAGTVPPVPFVAGELAFITATTNNQSVQVDFASWVQDSHKNPVVLGNVQPTAPPTFAEALYIALDNGDGTVSIVLDDAASRTALMPGGMTNSTVDLNMAYRAYRGGIAPKPIPRRCGAALFLNTWFGEAVPAGKCDAGLSWAPGFCAVGSSPWSTISGTTAPMSGYMQVTQSAGAYKRGPLAAAVCGAMKPVLSETYIHMWEKNFDLTAGACVPESNGYFCARQNKNCGTLTGTDNCGNARTVSSCGTCGTGMACGAEGMPNVCGVSNTVTVEAEALGNTRGGSAAAAICPEAFSKVGGGSDPGNITGACSAGGKVTGLGGSSANYVVVRNINVGTAGSYKLTVWGATVDPRTFSLSVNGGAPTSITLDGADAITPVAVTTTVTLIAGSNTIKLYNDGAAAPDLDRVKVAPAVVSCTAESNAAFCARVGKNCGVVSGLDNCSALRTVTSCGTCLSPATCGGGGFPNVCGSR
jgi:hypothetical protein